MEKYDIVIIGAGPGGYPAAAHAAQSGAKVAIIEKELLGGCCLNWGCIPTKAMIASADLYHHMQNAENLCLKAEKLSFDYPGMMKRNAKVIKTLRDHVEKLMNSSKVHIYKGVGSFVNRNKIVINNGKKKTYIQADKTIIATGSETFYPDYLPKHKRVLGSRAFLGLKQLPPRLIIMGAGVIACEFASIAAQLGTEVTIVKRKHRENLGDILRVIDDDAVAVVKDYMENHLGIRILAGEKHEDKSFENITANDKEVSGTAGGKTIKADLLLAAIGRNPVTEGLNLEKIGLETNKRGYIEIDEYCRTKVPSIFAIGDVTPGSQLAHGATSEGITAVDNALGKRIKKEPFVPNCIFTSPEIASVGLTEKEAREKGYSIRVGKYFLENLGKALASGDTRGFVKWVADAKTGQLLGAYAACAHATELIAEAGVAVRAELTVEEIAHTIHCHPTLSEVWMEAANTIAPLIGLQF